MIKIKLNIFKKLRTKLRQKKFEDQTDII